MGWCMDWFWTAWAWLFTPVSGALAVGAGFLGLAPYVLEKSIGLTWRYHRWRRSRCYNRDLTRLSLDVPRNVNGRQGNVADLHRVLTETTGGAGLHDVLFRTLAASRAIFNRGGCCRSVE